MTTIETMKCELTKIQQAQAECVTESGFVRSECRYHYQELMRQGNAVRQSIDWMEAQQIKEVSSNDHTTTYQHDHRIDD